MSTYGGTVKTTPSAPSASQNCANSTLASVVRDAALKNTGTTLRPRAARSFMYAMTDLTISFFSSRVSRVTSPAEPRMKSWLVPYLIWRAIRSLKPSMSIWLSSVNGVGMATQEP